MSFTAQQLAELAADADEVSTDLASLAKLAELQLDLEGKVSIAEDILKKATAALNDIRDRKFPEALKAANVPEFVLGQGMKVKLSEELTASVPKARKGEVIAKLRELDAGDLVSNEITIDLGKGPDAAKLAEAFLSLAAKKGVSAKQEESVNTASLKAMLRQRLKDNLPTDLPFFGAFLVQRTKIETL